MKLLAGSSNLPLAKNIAQQLNLEIVDCEIAQFGNGEKRLRIKSDVAGHNIALVQSFTTPVDSQIIETLLMTDALERAGARNVNLIIPWLAYSLQDKVFQTGEPFSAKVIANLISNSYVARVYLLDLHNSSIPGLFSVPTEYLSAQDPFVEFIKTNLDLKQAVIVSPDFGGLKSARKLADILKLPLANIDKDRDLNTGKVTQVELHGQVKNKTAILFDDVIMSGGTAIKTAKLLKKQAAKKIYFLATHGIFCNKAQQKLTQSQLDQIIITNSVQHQQLDDKITVLDVAPIFATALKKWL
ncbi:MAG: ribose-phosphate diphosphokinase [Candidatus Pacebacteria bacterium]|nr:ribose-phosphate diphosphokinase [Candidatus Paceibacterota bacterium]